MITQGAATGIEARSEYFERSINDDLRPGLDRIEQMTSNGYARNLLKTAADFSRCRRGNFAFYTALIAIPLLAAAGLAVDYSRLLSDNRNLQQAVDSAALAAVSARDVSDKQRNKIAAEFLQSNFEGIFTTPAVTVTYDPIYRQVSVTAITSIENSLMNVVGMNDVGHRATAIAATKSARDVCVLGLNKTADKTISVSGSGARIKTNCIVQSNSENSKGLYNKSNTQSEAETFCSAGGYYGTNYAPKPKSDCYPIIDPYSALSVPDTTGCDVTDLKITNGIHTLWPGTYCGGMKISGGEVTFNPGLYVLKNGNMKINSAKISGNDVTFYFYGDGATLDFVGGADVELSAPKTGNYAGMLFVQHPNAEPGATSKVNGHPSTKLIGVSYFPTQEISIGGSGSFGAASPFMSLVADKILMHGNGTVTINNDPAAAGYKDIALPGTAMPYLIK